jgi:hypothetical protein
MRKKSVHAGILIINPNNPTVPSIPVRCSNRWWRWPESSICFLVAENEIYIHMVHPGLETVQQPK